ncbi:MAG: EEP domain-containing protein [Gammaproteobacteria bacterium]|uniref:endonuclease/exonuclease/phosphatase family protein n=1 Tax=Pseudomaricurvus alcaniphilus TaxID=1166482 RepID=UPI00140AF08C|nr:endonuclease/exonuclease/phosphatase family protein [Pseudomaricurvus alcaniphilus]MBR9911893.1 EEP domain-containing protein [Gammaproteobacteria bacterium]NHN36056.1 EEP domain-containing protein [Pseudomaricurvus alcaniphilus]
MSRSLKTLTYNIHKGFNVRNRDFILGSMRSAIREVHADVVALQEVIGEHRKHASRHANWHGEAHFEFMADQVWPHYAYGKNAIYQAGHHGNALLSKYPFHLLHNRDISQSRYSRRSILHGEIRPEGFGLEIHIACVHLGFMPFEQYRQLRLLSRWIDSLPAAAAVILMGDFNDWHQRIHRFLLRKHGLQEVTSHAQGELLPTYPARKPRVAMDRIYYRGLQLLDSQVCVGEHWAELSDHCPVVAEFLPR